MVGSSSRKRKEAGSAALGPGRAPSPSGRAEPGEQMGHQLEALRLPAAQGRAGLAEFDVIQARVAERLQRAGDFGKGREEPGGLRHCQVERFARCCGPATAPPAFPG